MVIGNARFYRNGRFEKTSMSFSDKIEGFGEPGGADANGAIIIPGLVDIHTHGAAGVDTSCCEAKDVPTLAEFYAEHGVTSFCYTTMTVSADALRHSMRSIRGYRRTGNAAKCAGVNLEGPFVSHEKRGSQNGDYILKPSIRLFYELNQYSGNQIRLVTVAPEVEGALDFIREASRVCTVSLGHSTADFNTAMEGFQAGATHVTHLFNGMQPFHHREPGLVGAALSSGASVELICDGMHIHPAVISAAYRMFGDKLAVISDSLNCTGLPDGEYMLGGQQIMMKNGLARLLDGTIAGSSADLLSELRNIIAYGIPAEDAIRAVTETPARIIGRFDKIGSLDVGKCADFIVLDKNLRLLATFIDGEQVNGSLILS